jgi:hypothetical protein
MCDTAIKVNTTASTQRTHPLRHRSMSNIREQLPYTWMHNNPFRITPKQGEHIPPHKRARCVMAVPEYREDLAHPHHQQHHERQLTKESIRRDPS